MTHSEVPRCVSAERTREIRAGALSIGAFERGRWRLRRTRGRFRADAGHYWNLNRYSTGRNQLLGSIVSIPNMEHRPEAYPICTWTAIYAAGNRLSRRR